jgi:hypothetical protein
MLCADIAEVHFLPHNAQSCRLDFTRCVVIKMLVIGWRTDPCHIIFFLGVEESVVVRFFALQHFSSPSQVVDDGVLLNRCAS